MARIPFEPSQRVTSRPTGYGFGSGASQDVAESAHHATTLGGHGGGSGHAKPALSAGDVVAYARQFDHRAWADPSSPGPYCALFMRHCFRHFGIELPASKAPSDFSLTRNMPQAESFANSLAGPEIGPRVGKHELQRGDLVFFTGTDSRYKMGVITHVGIYAGNGMIVDRGSAAVHFRSLATFSHFVEGRRPKVFGTAQAGDGSVMPNVHRTIIDFGAHGTAAKLRNMPTDKLIIAVFPGGYIEINGRPSKPLSYLVEVQGKNGQWFKAYGHDGKHEMLGMKSISGNLSNGMLQVRVDAQAEVKASNCRFVVVER